MFKGKTVFLSGPISGDPDYKVKFARADAYCRMMGARAVWNPAKLPGGKDYEWYMEANLNKLKGDSKCFHLPAPNILLALPGYLNSPGAQREVKEALNRGIQVVKFEELERLESFVKIRQVLCTFECAEQNPRECGENCAIRERLEEDQYNL